MSDVDFLRGVESIKTPPRVNEDVGESSFFVTYESGSTFNHLDEASDRSSAPDKNFKARKISPNPDSGPGSEGRKTCDNA